MDSKRIISTFISRYGQLKKYGLRVNGVTNLIGDTDVISISVPFIFDRRQLPNEFVGLTLRTDTYDLPMEFQNIDTDNEYIWAYQRFEKFVDNHSDLIKQKLDNLNLTRQEILDALCFGDYNKHKENCKKWESEGKIPKWIQK